MRAGVPDQLSFKGTDGLRLTLYFGKLGKMNLTLLEMILAGSILLALICFGAVYCIRKRFHKSVLSKKP